MKRCYSSFSLLLVVGLLATGPARAQEVDLLAEMSSAAAVADDILMRVERTPGTFIPGESRAVGYEGWIEVLSYSHSLSNAGGSAGGGRGGLGAGKAVHSPVNFLKYLDRSSPPLITALNTGQILYKTTFDFVRSGGDTRFVFFKVELENVAVTSYQLGHSAGAGLPVEGLSLVYSRVKMTYCEQSDTGAAGPCSQTSWDVTTNSAANALALSGPVVRLSGDTVGLEWGMQEQDGIYGFEVQRWAAGSFERASYTPGAGWTDEELAYSASVAGLERGIHVFRLALLGVDGRVTYSDEVRVALGVADGEELAVGAAFPNPFALRTTLPVAVARAQHARVTVLDVLGREVAVLFDGVMEPGGEALIQFSPAAHLASGLYALRVVTEERTTTRMVTLQR